MLNINEGKNELIVKNCRHLAHYSAFIAKAREFEKDGCSLQEAIKKAVVFCCDHDILKELLEENASEVLNMLMTEWNWDDAKQVWQDEAREEGIVQGRDEERQYFLDLINQGLSLEEIKKQISTTTA